MLLYSYYVIASDGCEVTPREYQLLSAAERKLLKVQVRRHFEDGKPLRVLSLVGGGIRGYMLGRTLEEIEKITGQKIAQLFDCIVGTSTGVPIAFALAYPEEVTVEDIMQSTEAHERFTTPHAATPKFSASMITKIYSHYGAYIFANPALKRVLDPFIQGKVDGETYLSAAELDARIEHEGEVIKLVAPSFQAAGVGDFSDIQAAIAELQGKIEFTKNLLEKLCLGESWIDIDIDPTALMAYGCFLQNFLLYPLSARLKEEMMVVLEEFIAAPLALATADVATAEAADTVTRAIDFRRSLIPKGKISWLINECIQELKQYYLNPLHALLDGIAEQEKLTTTFFDKSGVEEVLKRFVPNGAKLQDFLGCTAGAACVRDSLELRILDNLDPDTRRVPAHDTILACVSAQTFFPSQHIAGEDLVDAGTALKTPSQLALVLAGKYFPASDTRPIEVFEIGTGKTVKVDMAHPQKVTRMFDPSDSVTMVMEATRNSTAAIMQLIAGGNPLVKYHRLDFDLAEIELAKTTPSYFAAMDASIARLTREVVWGDFVRALRVGRVMPRPAVTATSSLGHDLVDSLMTVYRGALARQEEGLLEETREARLMSQMQSEMTPKFIKLLQTFRRAYAKYSARPYPAAPVVDYADGMVVDAGSWTSLIPSTAATAGEEVPVLSIDGGGTRGLWPLKTLEYLEKSTGKAIAELFPIKGGTSVGGLISILLSIPAPCGRKPFYTAVEVSALLENADRIFPLGNYRIIRNILDPSKRVMYDSDGLRGVISELIKKAVGSRGLKMRDLLGTVGVLSYDNETLGPIFLSSVTHPDLDVVDVAVCTASAPAYLPDSPLAIAGRLHKMGDGGIPDNNPVWYVYGMFEAIKRPGQIAKMLSLGTGIYPAAHPKRDEMPVWLAPGALLGFGMDSRTIAQDRLMEMYAATEGSDISHYSRVQCVLPSCIDLTSSLPVTLPLASTPECLPIAYKGDAKKVVDFKDLATIMAAKEICETASFAEFIRGLPGVDQYTPEMHFAVILRAHREEFERNWAVRLVDGISIKDICFDLLDPRVKRDFLELGYRVCLGLRFMYGDALGVDPDAILAGIDYTVLTANISRRAAEMGLDQEGALAGYVSKINDLWSIIGDQQKITNFFGEEIARAYFIVAEEMARIYPERIYTREPEVFLACLLVNIVKCIHENEAAKDFLDWAERQTYNPTFLHKVAKASQKLPRCVAEPLLCVGGKAGFQVIRLSIGSFNFGYRIGAGADVTADTTATVAVPQRSARIDTIARDRQLLQSFRAITPPMADELAGSQTIFVRVGGTLVQFVVSCARTVGEATLLLDTVEPIKVEQPAVAAIAAVEPAREEKDFMDSTLDYLEATLDSFDATMEKISTVAGTLGDIVDGTLRDYSSARMSVTHQWQGSRQAEEARRTGIAETEEQVTSVLGRLRGIIPFVSL